MVTHSFLFHNVKGIMKVKPSVGEALLVIFSLKRKINEK